MLNADEGTIDTPQPPRDRHANPFKVPARMTKWVFALTLAALLLLLGGALVTNWLVLKGLRAEIVTIQQKFREPVNAVLVIAQASWNYCTSPDNPEYYFGFFEAIGRYPGAGRPGETGAVTLAQQRLQEYHEAVQHGGSPSHAEAVNLAKSLNNLHQYGASASEQASQGVLSTIERHQQRSGWMILLAVLVSGTVALVAFAYIRRLERETDRQYGELNRDRQTLRDLSARLLNAQEQERKALARELHDEIGQALGALVLDAGRATSKITHSDDQAKSAVEEIRHRAENILHSVRDMALGLRPSMLDDLGLPAALDWLARETSRRGDVEVGLVMDGLAEPLPDEYNTCIYRVVQEGLHNASRHSGARNIQVDVRRSGPLVTIRVRDDGQGFDTATKRGLGLLGAAERLALLNGRLQIESAAGTGTSFTAELPVLERLKA